MKARKAESLRFAILTVRARFEAGRLTRSQRIFLYLVDPAQLMIGDRWTLRAYEREYEACKARLKRGRS